MKIERRISIHGNLMPDAYNVVSSISSEFIFNEDIGIKHPIVTYNLSSSRVSESLKDLHDLILQLDESHKFIKDIIASEIELMESMMSHIDDCYSILMSLQPSDVIMKSEKMIKKKAFPLQWLSEMKNPVYQKFENEIKKYRTTLGSTINDIKHNTGRLGFITCENEETNQIVYGFFHNKYLNKKIAIQPIRGDRIMLFHDDLKHHLFYFYYIGKCLSEAIASSLIHFHKNELKIINQKQSNEDIAQVLETVSQNPALLLRRFNIKPPAFNCEFIRANDDICFRINTSKNHNLIIWDAVKVSAIFSGDGYSREFELP